MKHIFIIDKFENLIYGHDSSLALMRESIKQGHQTYQAELHDLYWDMNELKINTQEILYKNNKLMKSLCVTQFNLSEQNNKEQIVLWMRKDPPVNEFYIRACQLLRLSVYPVINNPNILMAADEKLLALEFIKFIPMTFVSSDIIYILNLLQKYKKLILKPIGGKAGEGILLLNHGDVNVKSLLELSTNNQNKKVIVQEFIDASIHGDKRIFLLNGEPIGAILRKPAPGEHRANIAAGGGV